LARDPKSSEQIQSLVIIHAKNKENKEKKNAIFPLLLTGHLYVAFLCALCNNQTHFPCFILPFQEKKITEFQFP
jgi:hypothetical protein